MNLRLKRPAFLSSAAPLLKGWAALFKSRTLSRKILKGILPTVVGITLVMGAFSYYIVRRQILMGVQKEIDTLAQHAAMGLGSFFQQRRNDLESVSETPLVADYWKNVGFGLTHEAEMYRRELEKYFVNFAGRSRVYYDISYLRPDGRRVCSLRKSVSDSFGSPASLAFLDLLRQGKPLEAPLERMGEDGPLIKRYAKPVFDDSGAFLGAIILDCDMKNVEEILKSLRVGEQGGAFLEDEKGRPVLGFRPAFRQPLLGLAAIPKTAWKVGVIAQAEDFLLPLKQIKYFTVFFSILACLLVIALIVMRVSSLLKPIQMMVEGTQRFASGDLAYRFREPETKELRILSNSFNLMAANLEERTRQLERRLRQLTALRDMEEAVIQRLDEETILRICLESVARGFAFDRTGLYWVDHNRREIAGRLLYGAEAMGFTETSFRRRRVPLEGNDILNEVIRSRSAILVKQPVEDPRLDQSFLAETKTREFVMAPICGKDRVLGVLTADNYYSGRPLEESDKEGLTLFANAVGLALENTMLFQNLAESEARYRTVLENSPEAVIGLSREHWITTWNRGAELIFGYGAQEIVGKPVTALFGPASGTEFKKLLNSVMEKGFVRDCPMPGAGKGARALDLNVSWGGAHHEFWMNKEWALVIRDVTEARKMQQQLIRSEKLSAVGQLISGIAHELNNPLQAVVGYADLLWEEIQAAQPGQKPRTGADPSEPRNMAEELRIITENAMRCQKIIENLLLFVRQGEVEKVPVDLNRVIQASLDLLQYKLKKVANIEVEFDIPADLPRVRGNFQQIQQVFVNLVNNACDAMSGWAGAKMIRVHASESEGVVRVELADSGPGVPEKARDRLFEPFFTTKAEGRGTGLGLAVCRQIIEDHGGRIGFESQVGSGTTFWFTVPVAGEESRSIAAPPVPPPVRHKSVLLVDDEPDVLTFLTRAVQAEGDQVQQAASLKEATAKIAQGRFDLVVADIRLGEGTGIDLYENWGLWSRHPRPAFLFVTGDVINASLAQEIERKGLPIMHKPVNLESFQRTLRSLLAAKVGPF